ncbi:MAG: protein translocase subunit SecF [Acidimicrobiia bacterium]|nr:protein translocase subunit SecF [Acidimicrobiia bacterium]
MSFFGDMYRGTTTVDFPRLWRKTMVISLVLVAVSIGALAVRGLNLGIDFEGGTSLEVRADASVSDVRDAMTDAGGTDARIQTVGTDTIRVRTSIDDRDTVQDLRQALADEVGVPTEDVSVSVVGPTWGDEITDKAVRALVVFFVLIAAYISIRLEWKMAVGAVVAVVHDIIISVGVYAVFQFEVTPATVIAFLTIMGYSLYDTMVVYDKVREISNRVGATGRYTYTEMMNLGLNQVLARSINTTITSVLPVASMLVVGSLILGAVTLQEFGIALLVGLLVGGYSSLFVASAVVAKLKEREPQSVQIRERLAARGDAGDETRMVSAEDAAVGAAPKRSIRATSGGRETTQRSAPGSGVIPPRPRKKRKR